MLTGKKPYPIWLAAHPDQKYKGKGWKSWGHFLGTGTIQAQKKIFCSFSYCRNHLRSLKVLKSGHDFQKYRKGTFAGLPKALKKPHLILMKDIKN